MCPTAMLAPSVPCMRQNAASKPSLQTTCARISARSTPLQSVHAYLGQLLPNMVILGYLCLAVDGDRIALLLQRSFLCEATKTHAKECQQGFRYKASKSPPIERKPSDAWEHTIIQLDSCARVVRRATDCATLRRQGVR